MPTSNVAFAAVARILGNVDPKDTKAVTVFYRRRFTEFSESARALIQDFLLCQTGQPSERDLEALKDAIAKPDTEIPKVDAPARDQAFGDVVENGMVRAPANQAKQQVTAV